MINILIISTIIGFLFFYKNKEKNLAIIMLYFVIFSLHLKYTQKIENMTSEKYQTIESMVNSGTIRTNKLIIGDKLEIGIGDGGKGNPYISTFGGSNLDIAAEGYTYFYTSIISERDITSRGNIYSTGNIVSNGTIHGNELLANGTVTGTIGVTSGGNINIPEKKSLIFGGNTGVGISYSKPNFVAYRKSDGHNLFLSNIDGLTMHSPHGGELGRVGGWMAYDNGVHK